MVLGCALGALVPAPARAQFDDPFAEPDTTAAEEQEREEDDSVLAEEEEAAAAASAGETGNQPVYGTNYDVTKQSTTWGQSFAFGAKGALWDLKSNTDFSIGRDSGSDSETRAGNTRGTLNFRGLKGLPLLFDMRLGRTSVDAIAVQSQNETRNVGLTARLNRRWLGIRHNAGLKGGYDLAQNLSANSTNNETSESTESGFSGRFDWRANANLAPGLKLDADYSQDRAKKTSELVQSGADSVRSVPTTKRASSMGVKLEYNPANWLASSAGYTNRTSEEELFLLQSGEGQLERRENDNKTLNFTFTLTPRKGTTLTWNMSRNETFADFRVRPQLASRGEGDDWAGKLSTELLKTKIEAELSRKRDFTEPRQTIASERLLKVFEGRAQRALSPRFDARVNWEIRLRQQFFEGDPAEVQDKDEQKIKVDAGLAYKPPGRWSATLSYARDNTRQVEVNQIRAGETNTQENHTVTVGIKYDMSARTKVTQNYYIQASYTTFDFQPRKNTLNATQRIVTGVNSQVTSKVKLGLTHNFNLIDSGPFALDPDRGRVFKRSSRAYRQDLTATVDYIVTPWLTLTANQRFFRSDNLNEATGDRRISRDIQLREGFKIQQELGAGLKLRADGEYVRSSTTESYFTLRSSLDKEF